MDGMSYVFLDGSYEGFNFEVCVPSGAIRSRPADSGSPQALRASRTIETGVMAGTHLARLPRQVLIM